jgi:hypothetical protein
MATNTTRPDRLSAAERRIDACQVITATSGAESILGMEGCRA